MSPKLKGDKKPRTPLRHVQARPQLVFGTILSVALFFLPLPVEPDTRLLIAFDAGALAFLVTIAIDMARAHPETMRRRALAHEEGKWTVLTIAAVLSLVVMVAIVVELRGAREASILKVALAAATVFLSWAFSNTIFALHYAHAYYGGTRQIAKGLEFPGTEEPNYWDFIYFAFVVGTTFQTSDVAISARPIRHTVAAHGSIAFFFTVIAVAITVNIVAGAV